MIIDAGAPCPCPRCRRVRQLESKRDVAEDVLAGDRQFVCNVDGRALWREGDVRELLAGVERAIALLNERGCGALPGRRARRATRSIGNFMAQSSADLFDGNPPGWANLTARGRWAMAAAMHGQRPREP